MNISHIGWRKYRRGPDRARCCAGLAPPCHPARQSARAGVFRGGRLSPLPATGRRGSAARRHSSLGLLPDAQSRPPDRDAGGRGWLAGDLCRSAPALHRDDQRSVPVDGPSLPGPLWRGGDGRAAFVGGSPLYRSQSGRRGLVRRAEDWPWSSTRAQLSGEDHDRATVEPLRALIPDFAALLAMPTDAATTTRIERAPTIGRPLGRPEWIAMLECRLGRPLAPCKPGPKPRVERDSARQAQLL